MLITELGVVVTLLIGVSIGFGGFAILIPWIQFFWRDFDAESKCFWPLFYGNMIFWVVGTCVVSVDWLNETVHLWGKPILAIFIIMLAGMAISKLRNIK